MTVGTLVTISGLATTPGVQTFATDNVVQTAATVDSSATTAHTSATEATTTQDQAEIAPTLEEAATDSQVTASTSVASDSTSRTNASSENNVASNTEVETVIDSNAKADTNVAPHSSSTTSTDPIDATNPTLRSGDSGATSVQATQSEPATATNRVPVDSELMASAIAQADGNTLTLPAGFDLNLFADADEPTQFAAQHATIAAIMALGEQDPTNSYHASAEDQAVAISQLPESASVDIALSNFAAGILNQVRLQLGNTTLTLSKGAVDFARDISLAYQQDQWQIVRHADHDLAAISSVASQYGLPADRNYYENISAGYLTSTTKPTLASLKQGIYETIMDMLFADGDLNFGHTLSLIGYVGHQQTPSTSEYLGVSVDAMGQIHLFLVPNQKIEQSNKFDVSPVMVPTTAELLANQDVATTSTTTTKATNPSTQQPGSGTGKTVTLSSPARAKQPATRKLASSAPASLQGITPKVTTNQAKGAEKQVTSNRQRAIQLPQTNENTTRNLISSLIGWLMTTMAVLLGLKRHRQEN